MNKTAPSNQLPDFLIIGAMKAGTDSLYYYLNAHPEIDMCKIKEPDFFLDKNWDNGVDWYKNLFRSNSMIKGDASPNLTKYPAIDKMPERIYSIVPDVKLIYLIRNPIDRIISHLHHCLTANYISESDIPTVFDTQFGRHMINCSRYYMQIDRYLKMFRDEQIFLLLSEDLASNPDRSMQRIFDFVGADNSFTSPVFHQRFHQSKDKIQISNRSSRTIKLLRKLNNHPMLPNKIITRSFYKLTNILSDKQKQGLFKQAPKPNLSNDTIHLLKSELSDDISQLREYMGRDLEEWNN